MAQIEYLGKTKDGVEVVVRNDGMHYRAFNRKTNELIGTPKIKFSALSAELGLVMDGSRPETDQQTAAPAEVPVAAPAEVPVAAPVKSHFGKTRDGVAVEVSWNGTHWLAVDAAGEMVGTPMIHLQDLAKKIGLVYNGGEGEPGEKDLTGGETGEQGTGEDIDRPGVPPDVPAAPGEAERVAPAGLVDENVARAMADEVPGA